MKRYILLLVIPVLLASCEKVIEVDLNSADPKMVFEANLAQAADTLWFSITKTADYFGNDPNPTVNNADIDFTDGVGNTTRAVAKGNGRYAVGVTNVKADMNYSVKVDVAGQITTAESYMPVPVMLDSLTFEYTAANQFVDESYIITISFQDPPDTLNYYRLRVLVNGAEQGDITVFNDKFSQGTYLNIPLFGYELVKGDVVEVQLQSIDAEVYQYFLTLASIVSQTGPPGIAPGNPTTNLKGDIQLGYFGTYSYSALSDTIK